MLERCFCWRPHLVKWQEVVSVDGPALGQILINLTWRERHERNVARNCRVMLAQETPCLGYFPFSTNFLPSHYTGFPLFPLRKLVTMSFPIHIGALESDKGCEDTMSILGHVLWLTTWWSAFDLPRQLMQESMLPMLRAFENDMLMFSSLRSCLDPKAAWKKRSLENRVHQACVHISCPVKAKARFLLHCGQPLVAWRWHAAPWPPK